MPESNPAPPRLPAPLFPAHLLFAAMLLTVLALMGLAWSGFDGYRTLAPLVTPAVCLVLAGAWWWVIRRLGRWQALVLEQVRCRAAAENRVRELNRDLEARVAARTQALADSEALLRTVIDNAPVVLHALDAQGTILLSRGRGLEALGLAPEQLVGQPVDDLYWDIPELAGHFHRALAGETIRAQVQVRGVIHDTVYTPVTDSRGRVTTVILVATDITERWQAQEKVRRLAAALEQSPRGVLIRDARGIIDYVNPRFCELTGYRAEQLLGYPRTTLPCCPADDKQEQTPAAGQTWHREYQQRCRDDRLFWAEVTVSPLLDGQGFVTHYLETLEDISPRKRREAQLMRQSSFDPVTGLPNRLLALDRLEAAISRAGRDGGQVEVMIVFLEGLKEARAALEARALDPLLREAAMGLVNCVEPADTVARLRGEEFLVLLADRTTPCAEVVEAAIRATFAEPLHSGLRLTPLIGRADSRTDSLDSAALLCRADAELGRVRPLPPSHRRETRLYGYA